MIIALICVLVLVLVFVGAYLHYQWTERGHAISAESVNSQGQIRQLYEQGLNPDMTEKLFQEKINGDIQLDEGRFYSHINADALDKKLVSYKFKNTAAYLGDIDHSLVWNGKIGDFPVTLLTSSREGTLCSGGVVQFEDPQYKHLHYHLALSESAANEISTVDFVDDPNDEDELVEVVDPKAKEQGLSYRRLSDFKLFYPRSEKADKAVEEFTEALLDSCRIFQKIPKKTVVETTRVHRLENSDYGNGLEITPMDTKTLYKFGEVLSDCPEMFGDNFDMRYNNRKLPFNGKQTFEFLTGAYKSCPEQNFSAILFGKTGTGKSSYLNALAFHLGKDYTNFVVMVDGAQLTDATKNASLLTMLRKRRDFGSRVIVLIDEADNMLRTVDGKKTTESAAIMSLQNDVSVIFTCNLEESEIHEAFLRTGRGDVLIHIGELSEPQKVAISNYIERKAKGTKNMEFHRKEIRVLSDAWAQLQPRGLEDKIEEVIKAISKGDPVPAPSSSEPMAMSGNNQTLNAKSPTVNRLKRFNNNKRN